MRIPTHNAPKSKYFTALLGLALLATSANAALVTIDSITGFSGGDSYTPGDFSQLTDGIGIDTTTDANDPSTWVHDDSNLGGSTNYQTEWYDHYLDSTTSANSKIGWMSMDLGSETTDLVSLFIFNGIYNNGELSSQNINVYTAVTPTVALPSPPGQNSAVDYDFASGGWTLLSSPTLTKVGTSADEIDLSGVASARYIGVEIMTAHTTDGRTGFDEVAITAIPEPSAVLLGSLGGLLLLRRRRG